MFKDTFYKMQKLDFPNAASDVLEFIANIITDRSASLNKGIVDFFGKGYCYYFALMLKDAFGGAIFISVEEQHILWKDTRAGAGYGLFYDIHGAHKDNEHYIPISDMFEALECYRHRGKDHELFLEIEEYKEKHGLNDAELNEKVFAIIPDQNKTYPYPNEEDTLRYFKSWLFPLK